MTITRAKHRGQGRRAERLVARVAVLAAEAEALAVQQAAAAERLRRLQCHGGSALELWVSVRTLANTTRRLATVLEATERVRRQADDLIDELRYCGYRELADGCWLTPSGAVIERSGMRTRGHTEAT